MSDYKVLINQANHYILKSLEISDYKECQKSRKNAIDIYNKFLNNIQITEYLLIDSNPNIPKDIFIDSHFKLGTLYKSYIEDELRYKSQSDKLVINKYHFQIFEKALDSFRSILKLDYENKLALKQIVSIYTQLCVLTQNDFNQCLNFLQNALFFAPTNPTIHYNLGHIYNKQNKLELSLIHYKLSIELCSHENKNEEKKENQQLLLNNLNGISSLYRSIKQWPEALYYLKKAEEINQTDPDIQNQMGVVYTEMRRTDLAEISYNKAIQHYEKSFITPDHTSFLSDVYLNLGHMHSYNGNNSKSVESYNKSLKLSPNFNLPFQNKIMNLSYLFDELEDKMYIYNQHKLINKLFKEPDVKYQFTKSFFDSYTTSGIINIGIISGDFLDHPVQFFISTFLKNFDNSRFKITCYSECVIDTSLYNNNLNFKFIKNMSAKTASDLIYNDNIHILFDLAGHTAFNRLDIFKFKPSPIQITYVGYPYSTGLNEMDYRITDNVCDKEEVSQKFYTEKLLYLKDCFLCYNPSSINKNRIDSKLPVLSEQPFLKNKKEYITIACFNRVNKITDNVIKLFNNILLKYNNVKFVFKTKALLNKNVKDQFINKFDKNVTSRIIIKDCTLTHEQHILEYNEIDIAIDTFPYSGTTTSCESLLQGVPVFTLYDSEYYFHPQNVTASILTNSHQDLKYYVCDNTAEIIDKIGELLVKPESFWSELKQKVRTQFLNGNVCNKDVYMNNIQTLLSDLFIQHKEMAL